MTFKPFVVLLKFTAIWTLTAICAFGQSVITSIPVNGTPHGVAVDPVTNRIYAAINPSSVAVIDGATNTVLETVPLPFGAFQVRVDSSSKRIYIGGCDFSSGPPVTCGVSVLDASSNRLAGSIFIDLNTGIGIQGLAVNPRTNRIYVSDGDNLEVDVIDGASNTIIDKISLGGSQPLGLAVDARTNRLFVTINGDEVAVIDGATDAIEKRILVGQENANDAVDPLTHRGYVTNEIFGPSTLGVVDTRHLRFVTNITVGNTPFDVAVDQSTDLVFVTNIGDATISVIKGAPNKNVATIQVFGRFIAVNPASHRVYASDDISNTIHVISEP